MSAARAFTFCLLALVVALAGCGSSPKTISKSQYETELQTLGAKLTTAGQELGKSIDIATFNRHVDLLQKGLRDAAKELEGVKPPADVRDANKQLAQSLRGFADALEPVKEARRQSIVKARAALGQAGQSEAVKQGRDAIHTLGAKGYDTGQFGTL